MVNSLEHISNEELNIIFVKEEKENDRKFLFYIKSLSQMHLTGESITQMLSYYHTCNISSKALLSLILSLITQSHHWIPMISIMSSVFLFHERPGELRIKKKKKTKNQTWCFEFDSMSGNFLGLSFKYFKTSIVNRIIYQTRYNSGIIVVRACLRHQEA